MLPLSPTPLKTLVRALRVLVRRTCFRRAIGTLLFVCVALQTTAPVLHAETNVPACGFAEIVGVVTGSDNGLPLNEVDVNGVGQEVVEEIDTNAAGRYTLTLPIYRDRGPYTIAFEPPNNSPYIPLGPLSTQAISGTTTTLDAELILGGVIRGRVTAADTGDPLEGVRVRASGVVILEDNDPMLRATDTDADGEYVLDGLIGGEYVIRYDTHSSLAVTTTEAYETAFVGGGNFPSEATVFPVSAGQAITVNFTIVQGKILTGEVRRSDTSALASDVEVQVYLLDEDGSGRSDFIQSTTTDDMGVYRFEGLAAGKYLLLARPIKLGFGPESPNIDLKAEWYNNAANIDAASVIEIPDLTSPQGISLNLTLDPGVVITGIVTDADSGAPVEGIGVGVRPRPAEEGITHIVYQARSDATGHYTITSLHEGTYGIITDPGFTAYGTVGRNSFTGITLTVGAGGASNVNFTLQRGGEIEGMLTNGQDDPLANIEVSLISPTTGRVIRRTTSNASGAYSFSNVTPGEYNVKYDRFEPCGCYNDEYFGQEGSNPIGLVTVEAQETTTGVNRQLACNAPPANLVEMYLPRLAP